MTLFYVSNSLTKGTKRNAQNLIDGSIQSPVIASAFEKKYEAIHDLFVECSKRS